ncbi:C4-dicarboxylate ABC transporter permease [Bosea caraganae]|uniref:TRAP transporter small permease protein n=1 Tax=Bosea caraganae TaxID=2763117 RepID=A0A370LAM6_9HYPH|nr:TRAP transporter small permease subunit [Bosea caraganae]RDJ22053.1 C4-dicarboxylate ABC transporter permease [Bosea caraganae]RDJ28363.1 C4-dicarboxylate ABC transporter permease [Bosea caraganae]
MVLTGPIDTVGSALGVVANWLVLLCCLLSAGNAIVRYTLTPIRNVLADQSLTSFHPLLAWLMPAIEAYGLYANAFLEGQWYMFAGMVLFGAAYTLRVNEHVRVDLLYGMYTDRTRHWVDFLGGIVFLMPMCIILIYFTWPWFVQAWVLGERSTNAGGLIRWPVYLLLPIGFGLVGLQGFSEIIKRAAAIRGFHQHEYAYEKPLQ